MNVERLKEIISAELLMKASNDELSNFMSSKLTNDFWTLVADLIIHKNDTCKEDVVNHLIQCVISHKPFLHSVVKKNKEIE
jgi:hypothetical protein